jgi:hypothetical protein
MTTPIYVAPNLNKTGCRKSIESYSNGRYKRAVEAQRLPRGHDKEKGKLKERNVDT